MLPPNVERYACLWSVKVLAVNQQLSPPGIRLLFPQDLDTYVYNNVNITCKHLYTLRLETSLNFILNCGGSLQGIGYTLYPAREIGCGDVLGG